MSSAVGRPAWAGPTELLPTVDAPVLVRPYVLAMTGSCRWCRRPIVLSPGRLWLHTDLNPECTDRWGWTIVGYCAEPPPRPARAQAAGLR